MSVKRCGNCGHPVYRHAPDDLELCRVADCPCPGFLTVKAGYNPVQRLRDAIRFDAIPTLLIFADGNAGVQAVIAKLRRPHLDRRRA